MALYKRRGQSSVFTRKTRTRSDSLLQLEQGYDPSHLVFFLWQKSQANLAVRRLAVGSRNTGFRGVPRGAAEAAAEGAAEGVSMSMDRCDGP